jgi:hypothetical protein
LGTSRRGFTPAVCDLDHNPAQNARFVSAIASRVQVGDQPTFRAADEFAKVCHAVKPDTNVDRL